MAAILGVLMVLCLIMIIIGLVKPSAAIRWGKPEKRKRGKVLWVYGTALIVVFFLIGAVTESEETSASVAASEPSVQSSHDKQGSETPQTDRVMADSESAAAETGSSEPEKKRTLEPDSVSAKDIEKAKVLQTEWNTTEPDAIENGNFYKAVEVIEAIGNIPEGQIVAAEDVLKAPWDYYGQPLTFTGVVEVVQDLPPGSEDYKAGRQSDVVMAAEDGTIIEFFIMIPSSGIKVGQTVTLTGYSIGRSEVDNALGGTYTHLIMVTNELE